MSWAIANGRTRTAGHEKYEASETGCGKDTGAEKILERKQEVAGGT